MSFKRVIFSSLKSMKFCHRLQKFGDCLCVISCNSMGVRKFEISLFEEILLFCERFSKICNSLKAHCSESGRLWERWFVKSKSFCCSPCNSNYLKSFEDGLNGVLWKDDALIIKGIIEKRYSENPHLEIEVTEWSEQYGNTR